MQVDSLRDVLGKQETVPFLVLQLMSSGLLYHWLFCLLAETDLANTRAKRSEERTFACLDHMVEKGFPSLVLRAMRKSLVDTENFYESMHVQFIVYLEKLVLERFAKLVLKSPLDYDQALEEWLIQDDPQSAVGEFKDLVMCLQSADSLDQNGGIELIRWLAAHAPHLDMSLIYHSLSKLAPGGIRYWTGLSDFSMFWNKAPATLQQCFLLFAKAHFEKKLYEVVSHIGWLSSA